MTWQMPPKQQLPGVSEMLGIPMVVIVHCETPDMFVASLMIIIPIHAGIIFIGLWELAFFNV